MGWKMNAVVQGPAPEAHLGTGDEEGFSEAGGSSGVPGSGCGLRQGSRGPWGWKETALQSTPLQGVRSA